MFGGFFMDLDQELAYLKQEFNRYRKAKGRRIFPNSLKLRILDIWVSGRCSLSELSERCGVHKSQLYFWRNENKDSLDSKKSYEIRTIPIIKSNSEVPEVKTDFKKDCSKKPFLFFRFFSFKVSLG